MRSAVGRLEHAALGVCSPEVTLRGDVDDVGISWMDHDTGNDARVDKAHVVPALAAVGGLVNAIAPRLRTRRVAFAGPDPDDIRVRPRNGETADRLHAK